MMFVVKKAKFTEQKYLMLSPNLRFLMAKTEMDYQYQATMKKKGKTIFMITEKMAKSLWIIYLLIWTKKQKKNTKKESYH